MARDLPFSKIMDFWEYMEHEYGVQGQALLGRADRFYLLARLCRRHDVLHPWLFERCRMVETEPDGCLDLWAREHYKSTIITFAGIIQEIVNDPEITIGVFSHTKPVARKFLLQIKLELEANELLQAVYPDVLYRDPKNESPRWSEEKGLVVHRRTNPKEATLEAHGLVDGQPTGAHFRLRVYDDVVTRESVSTPDQVQKTTDAWALSDNLGARGADGRTRAWHIGTRYCTVAGTKILMADWSHKCIEDVKEGDIVVGWTLKAGKRWLKPVRVLKTGMHRAQPVNCYTFDSGRAIVCTPDHKWWKGAHGSGDEYKPLTVPATRNRRKDGVKSIGAPWASKGKGMASVRELLVPMTRDCGRDAGWLAGMFDGEGTTKKNKNHPSGVPCITQTMHNPELIEQLRTVLRRLGFAWSESWMTAQALRLASPERGTKSDRCVFALNGGWRERYRFLAQIAPSKVRDLAPTLFGQLQTEGRKLVSVEGLPPADVYWLETESGNYIADGFCSKNSFADTYQHMLDKKLLKPRIFAATDTGELDGKPVFLLPEVWEEKKITQGPAICAAQMLQNPAAGNEAMFKREWLTYIDIRPATLNVYIMVDPAQSRKKGTDSTAIAAVGVDAQRNKYLLDGYRHKMSLRERWVAIRNMRKTWMAQPGVQNVKVGYERYGMQSDIEYFEEQMTREGEAFEIVELAWPLEGSGSKADRVQRLQPDFYAKRFYLPLVSKDETAGRRKMRESGQAFRIFEDTRRRDQDGHMYSLSQAFVDEFVTFPFSTHDDMIDAVSRIYDMEPVPPVIIDQSILEPAIYADGA